MIKHIEKVSSCGLRNNFKNNITMHAYGGTKILVKINKNFKNSQQSVLLGILKL